MGKPSKWTLEALRASASKYSTIKEWRTNEPSAYATASARGIREELASHMSKAIDHGYWTEKRVSASAKKYSYKTQWAKAEPSAPQAARRLGIYDQVTAHMGVIGNKRKRCVYVITVSGTQLAYVGLTGNPKKRFADHLKTERFTKLAKDHGQSAIVFKQVTEFLDVEDAQIAEGETLQRFRSQGFKMLNRAKAGAVGGTDLIWTDEAIKVEVGKFTTIKAWKEFSPSSYSAASKKGIVSEVSSHMERLFEEKWDRDSIFENARQFNHKVRWKEAFPGAVLAARRLGIFDEATSHMVVLSDRGKWTKDAVLKEAKKYSKISEWHKCSVGSYEAALRGKYIPEASAHMENSKVHVWTEELLTQEKSRYSSFEDWKKSSPSSFLAARKLSLFGLKPPIKRGKRSPKWTKARVIKSATKYTTRSEWKNAESGAYKVAREKGWLAAATAHMQVLNPVGRRKSRNAILEDAGKYRTKSEWNRRSAGAYEAAKRLGCFEEATLHMRVLRKKWTPDSIKASTESFQTLSEWMGEHPGAYNAARKFGILDEVTKRLQKGRRGKWTEAEIIKSTKNYSSFEEWRKDKPGRYQAAWKLGILPTVKDLLP